MQGQLISKETLELAWTKGFNQVDLGLSILSTPRQSELQRWLREVHSIDIDITRGGVRDDWYVGFRKFGYGYNRLITIYKSYELALEAGLLAALKLIK